MCLVFLQHLGGHPYTHIGVKLKPLLASDSLALRAGEHVCGVVRSMGTVCLGRRQARPRYAEILLNKSLHR